MVDILNPNHPALKDLEWHKVAAVLVHMLGGEVVISEEVFASMPDKFAIAVFSGDDHIRLKMMTQEEAQRLAREQGGLPN